MRSTEALNSGPNGEYKAAGEIPGGRSQDMSNSGRRINMNEAQLAQLISSGEVVIRNPDAFFTNQDRTTQINDEYSLKAEVFNVKGNNKIAVIHAHLEGQDAITKAHVKSDHNGAKLFDLAPLSKNAAYILGSAFGSGYKVAF
jgi:monoamine oxidase